jgi:hypothetical protein
MVLGNTDASTKKNPMDSAVINLFSTAGRSIVIHQISFRSGPRYNRARAMISTRTA